MMTTVEQERFTEAFIDEDITAERVGKAMWETCVAIARELWTFEWRDSEWSIIWQNNEVRLQFVTWVLDNDDPDAEMIQPLNASVAVRVGVDAREQIRDHIHGFLAHEADEQMTFDGKRPFYPQHRTVERLR